MMPKPNPEVTDKYNRKKLSGVLADEFDSVLSNTIKNHAEEVKA
jgi:hypothetical protein